MQRGNQVPDRVR